MDPCTESKDSQATDMSKASSGPGNVSIRGVGIDTFSQGVESIDILLGCVEYGVENRQVGHREVGIEV